MVLADGQSQPYGIAVNGTAIYWVNNVVGGAVLKVAK